MSNQKNHTPIKGNVIMNKVNMRINKYISSTGLCSRRKAEEYIEKGQVTINGQLAVLS